MSSETTGSGGAPLPFHLVGNYAPVSQEVTAFDLPVQGKIPAELSGRYVRNGPNPRTGTSPHWFAGDGMLHGVALRGGKAAWYRNRYVRTRAYLEDASMLRPDGGVDLTVGVANTHIVAHAGRTLALVESSLPTEVTRELDTVGCCDFGGRLTTPMTAHPKICPLTGELHFFGYSFFPPFLTYHKADASGALRHSQVIDVPGPTMIHDFAITERHVVFMDLPVVFDLELAQSGTMPYRWSDEYEARLGLMPRGSDGAAVRWFDVEPCYVFHTVNAFEDGGQVVVDTARYESLWKATGDFSTPARLHRWRIDPAAGAVREERLDDRDIEFPRCDERRTGLPNRYGYGVCTPKDSDRRAGNGLIKYDLRTGAGVVHECGPGRIAAEGVFVPASAGAGEDDGWLMGYVYDGARDGSDFVILDAADFARPPIATIRLPQRVPFGFHGSWFPDPA